MSTYHKRQPPKGKGEVGERPARVLQIFSGSRLTVRVAAAAAVAAAVAVAVRVRRGSLQVVDFFHDVFFN